MAQNNLHITPENSSEWLASCGFIFPTTEIELLRFNELHGEIDPTITGNEVDPFKIINRSKNVVTMNPKPNIINLKLEPHKVVAKTMNDLPSHIINKLKSKSGDSDSLTKGDDK